jgi:tRNA U34 5-carboxymethylaminomethyl modifying GTPase MnmE/TrmE
LQFRDWCFVLLGEFTLRAFLNGRLDLSQAENVARLISAKSMAAADAALEGIQACLAQFCFLLFIMVLCACVSCETWFIGCICYVYLVSFLLLLMVE